MEINLNDISQGLPGLTKTSGEHLYEGCVVCLSRHNHSNSSTAFTVYGEENINCTLTWNNIFDEQLERTWADQNVATESAAVCLSILLTLKLTKFTIIQRSAGKNGIDYWLGEKDDFLFQNKARLEVSGIFTGTEKDLLARFKSKSKQTEKSDYLKLPAYVGVVEFSKPMAKFGMKK